MSPPRVLVVGGYGNFGRVIAQRLARDGSCHVIVAGRDSGAAAQAARELKADAMALDIADPSLAGRIRDSGARIAQLRGLTASSDTERGSRCRRCAAARSWP